MASQEVYIRHCMSPVVCHPADRFCYEPGKGPPRITGRHFVGGVSFQGERCWQQLWGAVSDWRAKLDLGGSGWADRTRTSLALLQLGLAIEEPCQSAPEGRKIPK